MPKLDLNKPIETSDGKKARVICSDRKSEYWPIVALVENPGGSEAVLYVDEDGAIQGFTTNIVNVPVRTSKYRNVYLNGGPSGKHDTVVAALRAATLHDGRRDPGHIGVMKFDYIDGVFQDATFIKRSIG